MNMERNRGKRAADVGASAVEYGLLVGLIAVVIIGAVAILGNTMNSQFTEINEQLQSQAPATATEIEENQEEIQQQLDDIQRQLDQQQ